MAAPGTEWLDRPEFIFRPWTPPEDPAKPRLPYIPGFTVQIYRHTAPPPFGNAYGPGTRTCLPTDHFHDMPQSELVITNPPLETEPPSYTGSDTARMTITTPIRIGSAHGAQVVACTVVQDGSKLFQAVAKIYDALYYRFAQSIGNVPRDVVMAADEDYSREAAAYEFLRNAEQTGHPKFVPDYFGSWTFDLPITYKGESRLRPIRMILIERLDGTTLLDALIRNDSSRVKDAFHYPEEWRLEVLARAMDGFVKQQHIGVDQADFADRNVMIVTNAECDDEKVAGIPLPRVVLIDYNISYVYSILGDTGHIVLSAPCNPIWHFWNMELRGFVGWIPHEWFERPKLKQEWLLRRFGTDEARALYAPIPVKLEFDEDE
ncbi:hypothetical protein KVR01_011606 [Diaporthe batatas]|uniref:uncharacterized protein n=1 Tax=Diaporthe batatas TaxID=748121 RepID=UPI001D04875B|nr:uncharacterized protein KVR01_011606 [Diaporthe batatas]KAG8158484.1 hypothetical protein KVR01_011606 [Diaporthe batatas]